MGTPFDEIDVRLWHSITRISMCVNMREQKNSVLDKFIGWRVIDIDASNIRFSIMQKKHSLLRITGHY